MSRFSSERLPPTDDRPSSVLTRFISPESSPGKFFVDSALPSEWKPKLLPCDSIWAMGFRKHSSAFIAVELRNLKTFEGFDKKSIDEVRALVRPIGAWIGELPNVQLWDQIGGFEKNLGHWHFPYRDNRITGTLDIFIIPGQGQSATLIASITEHDSFR